MEIAFSEKISPQLSAALLSPPYELGKEGGLSSGYLPESDSWEVIVKYVGDIEKIKEKYPSVLITRLLGNYAVLVIEKSLVNTVALCDEIIYMEKPKQFNYDVYEGSQASSITPYHTCGHPGYQRSYGRAGIYCARGSGRLPSAGCED